MTQAESSKQRLFGTDGIRGTANVEPMTSEIAMRVGMAVAQHFEGHGRVVIGKDTRLSGYMFETAIASGLCAMGVDVLLVGPLPTPAIAYIVRSMRADAGVVISASHNPHQDNGIKIFAGDGFKLPDEVEHKLESLVYALRDKQTLVPAEKIGKAVRIDDAGGRYVTHVKQAFPSLYKLDGIRMVVDCAHGAAYKVAPAVFAELGATIIHHGDHPDGRNINAGVGALHPERMRQMVIEQQADVGVAFDGDADRLVMCDHKGRLIDGDLILALCGRDLAKHGVLRGGGVVATVMSNLALDKALQRDGLVVQRTAVGDRYVVEAMREGGYNLGGEQSGHIICLDHSTTGDGIVSALQVLAVMVRRQQSLEELTRDYEPFPQVLRNFKVAKKVPIAELVEFNRQIQALEKKFGSDGRIVVRYSGTESVMRIMVEGEDEAVIHEVAANLEELAINELKRVRG